MQDWTPPNLDYPPPKAGEPALHRSARLGDAAAIRALAADGADLNAVFDIGLDPDAQAGGATPLMVAAGSGDGATAETVALLLELGADPKIEVASETAATFAVTGLGWNYRPGGDAERLRLLLQAGTPLPADPEAAPDFSLGGETKEAFVARAIPEFQSFAEAFAANLPLESSEFAEEWREEGLRAVAILCAYTHWAQETATH